MFVVSSNFIGNFKLSDNINRNLRIVALLYQQFYLANDQDKRLFCKPIILIIVSVIGAVLLLLFSHPDFSSAHYPPRYSAS